MAVALLGTGAAYLVAHNGSVGGGSEALLTDEGVVACSRQIAEGTVAEVEPLGAGERFRIVLDVERSYKPRPGEPRLVFTDRGPGVPEYYRPGTRMLVLVSGIEGEPPLTYPAGDLDQGRRMVERALPGAADLGCTGAG
ncbi:hypothetical protein [Streptomyces sp. SAI-170]|uniref:hypothetical protein n=1 Tax=Streptomyces sp. SAI-170 TaxID=3377729 RepID=UPI003C7A845F